MNARNEGRLTRSLRISRTLETPRDPYPRGRLAAVHQKSRKTGSPINKNWINPLRGSSFMTLHFIRRSPYSIYASDMLSLREWRLCAKLKKCTFHVQSVFDTAINQRLRHLSAQAMHHSQTTKLVFNVPSRN
jgi:hypothetical protein